MEGSDLRKFWYAYIECALWASTNLDSGQPLNKKYSKNDIDSESLAKMLNDCRDFTTDNGRNLDELIRDGLGAIEQCGHDFWLSRNGHGAGYFDRGYGALGDRLQSAARVWGESILYIGDDKKLHVS